MSLLDLQAARAPELPKKEYMKNRKRNRAPKFKKFLPSSDWSCWKQICWIQFVGVGWVPNVRWVGAAWWMLEPNVRKKHHRTGSGPAQGHANQRGVHRHEANLCEPQ